MPIAQFTIDGVLPPYVGPQGPGGAAEDMSPYGVTAFEVVTTLGSSDERKSILRGGPTSRGIAPHRLRSRVPVARRQLR
jgi:hypothetical protein